MTNLDQAEKAIKFAAARGYTPEGIATLLRELELLAPDLPERSRGMGTSGAVWYLPYHIGDIRRMGEHIVAFGHDCQNKPFRLVLTEEETDTIARTLLAAANHKKGEL